MLLENKIAIVTGASRGIGNSTAMLLAKNGADLVVNGTNEYLLSELSSEIESLGRRCIIVPGDVADPKTATRVVDETLKFYGKIDILVNNAGINMRSSTLDLELEDWHKIININLNGSFYFCKEVLPHMVKRKSGKIVNVSSTTAKTAHRNASPAYGASKAGLDYLTKHLALEMAKYNIRVNGVNPGPIETDMVKQWSNDYREKVIANIPIGRLGTPKNVADTILFLVTDMADFINGETININGGTYMN